MAAPAEARRRSSSNNRRRSASMRRSCAAAGFSPSSSPEKLRAPRVTAIEGRGDRPPPSASTALRAARTAALTFGTVARSCSNAVTSSASASSILRYRSRHPLYSFSSPAAFQLQFRSAPESTGLRALVIGYELMAGSLKIEFTARGVAGQLQ